MVGQQRDIYNTATTGVTSDNLGNPFVNYHTGADYTWTVNVSNGQLDITVISGSKEWSYTYKDSGLSDMMSGSKYAVAMVAKGDGGSVFKKAEIWGTPVYDLVKDNGDGTVTATVQEGIYSSTNINAVIAFYDAGGNMVSSETITSDGSQTITQTFSMPAGAATVKGFVFDGDPKNGDLLNAVSYEDEISDETANPVKVACVGDSLTEGHGSSNNSRYSYPAQLQRLLGRGYEVKNFGIGSRTVCNTDNGGGLRYIDYVGAYAGQKTWNTSAEYTVKDENGNEVKNTVYADETKASIYSDSKTFNPNIVVIMLGTNDRGIISESARQAEFEEVYGFMIDEYKTLGADVYVVVPPIADGSAESSGNNNIVTYIKPILEKFVKTKGVKMINMQYGPTTSMQTDGLHFNDTGYNAIAQTVYNALTEKVSVTYSDNEITVKPSASVFGDVALAAYANDGLSELVFNKKTLIQPNVETSYDISGIKTGAESVKFLAWKDVESMKPILKLFENAASSYGVSEQNGFTTVKGKANAPYASVVITAFDANGTVLYVNNTLADYDSNYSYTFTGSADSVYVNGSQVK